MKRSQFFKRDLHSFRKTYAPEPLCSDCEGDDRERAGTDDEEEAAAEPVKGSTVETTSTRDVVTASTLLNPESKITFG